ncbi:PAC2 family protein [Propioniciclava coleopterorum]|uniref:PAC2 family protein n=1 Tax=Propioniciclava coleopterorum TaxID=2714937 RepID=A0A6G7Y9P7_9ACTN|nr:PAC2 family protein [Propioniciclava coleopterorum]QIK73542.1 PAC2 family protein [Propioniciclava coleopterorum]
MSALTDLRRPVVVFAFSGWNDAGDAATGVVDHLSDVYDTDYGFSLDADEYYDLTQNRPVVVREGDHRTVQWATTEVLIAHLGERDVVLVNGPEPNFRWRGFSAALVSAFRSIKPERVIAMGAMLADAPHSRAVPISEDGTDYVGPSGIVGLLASACADAGLNVTTLWASVPHYVSDPPNPKATLALISRLEEFLDEPVDHGDLAAAAALWETRVDELVSEDVDIVEYVRELESRYDTAEATGEEIAQQFERYLRRRES